MNDPDLYFQHKKEMGKRFMDFRILLFKSLEELATETGYPAEKIHLLELGAIFPDFQFLDYFSGKYGLSLTWISTGVGPIFYKESGEIAIDFFDYCRYHSPNSEDFDEFIEICANHLKSVENSKPMNLE
jgi:hypothetical protein